MDGLAKWLGEQLDEDERIAREASGSTVVGERGNWRPAPGGDEWEASRTDCDEDELLVALRPGLLRPPEVMSGMWGAVVAFKPEFEDSRVSSPLPQFVHAARHDPARVLREIDAKRRVLARHSAAPVPAGSEWAEEYPYCAAHAYRAPDGTVVYPVELKNCPELRDLAAPYEDRPGYREEWRP